MAFRSIAKAGVWCAVAAMAVAAGASGQAIEGWDDVRIVDQTMSQSMVAVQLQRQIRDDLKKAISFETGKGAPRDEAEAADWFRRAADLGDPVAQNQMGYLYVWGIGVERNAAQAIRWFARAAGSGMQQAKLNMAVLFMRGIGVARDPQFARQILQELAERKNARAADYLGVIYMRGEGVPQDSKRAEEYFRLSAKGKNPEGEFAMGRLCWIEPGHEHDLRKAARYLRKSANAGYVPAMYTLGVLLTEHAELSRGGSGEAKMLLRRAAEAGTWQSSATLGVTEAQGEPGDAEAAFRWLTIAVKQGGPAAAAKLRENLERLKARLSAEQQEQQEQAAARWMEQHPHRDVFVFGGEGSEESLMAEVYAMPVHAAE